MTEPASIRYKNPGAMWGRVGPRPSEEREVATNNPLAMKWGSTTTFYLSDGLGQGNNIAVFDTWVQGICAQLDLWRSSPKYKNKRFADAIDTWDGHNNTPSYIAYVLAREPSMSRDTIMDDAFWRGPMAIAFLKAQAGHEAGKPYPAPDADWIEAQRCVFSGVASSAAVVKKKAAVAKKAAGPVIAGGTATAAAHQAGLPPWAAIAIGVAAAVIVAFVIWRSKQ